eukprot:gnl/MRDRNA2_/MRDRNA2_560498_c0_seq1.p1 gnl/MRDRNA2_/MRDRNA2_560498_c0~~gnl/MRDRNA2_/MRDRNA2_560498_c0_seq1.p1  ORF type:complete len:212 (-),score=41.49 gnl/MRDRNA2_/MRDRNA2_560498_c0_seq1:23-613(-)
MVVDPNAAAQCLRAGVGAEIELELGYALDSADKRAAVDWPPWGKPLKATGRVVCAKSEVSFEYTGGVLGGTSVSMGATAVWVISKSIHVLIASIATYDWADEQYRIVGLDPAKAKFIGVKNMMNFRVGYAAVTDVEVNAFILDIPGPTPPTLDNLPFRRLRRPTWLPPASKLMKEEVSEPTIRLFRRVRSATRSPT